MPKTAKRTIYSHETHIQQLAASKELIEIKWSPSIVSEIFEYIMSLDERERGEDSPGEWFFYLGGVRFDMKGCIYGWFESVRTDIRTDLRRRSTMATRKNPKNEDEGEVRRTHFYFRLSDGLFLLDSFGTGFVTNRRVEEYLASKAKIVFEKHGIQYIQFANLVDKGFLDKLDKFEVLRVAQIKLKVEQKAQYDEEDAIGHLQSQSQEFEANYLNVDIGKSRAKKRGMNVQKVAGFLRQLMKNRSEIISGTIEGIRSDGGSPKLKLKGIEEKYPKTFNTDSNGEVLSEDVINYIMEIGLNHKQL